jgi:hypothetical protein
LGERLLPVLAVNRRRVKTTAMAVNGFDSR